MIFGIKYKMINYTRKYKVFSDNIIKNVVLSFGIKGGGVIISLMLIPMVINYINPIQYGIWITISAVVNWLNFFDIGIGNGLKNKLTIAVANNNLEDAKKYVSTTYATIFILALVLSLTYTLMLPYINWGFLIKIPINSKTNIKELLSIITYSFFILFVLQILNSVLSAIQEVYVIGLLSLISQFSIYLIIYTFRQRIEGELKNVVLIMSIVPVVVTLLASAILYNTKIKYLRPSLKYINYKYIKDILTLGGGFFFIQIGVLILFQTNILVINNMLGPKAVTEYNIAFKLFSIVSIIFSIYITPYWSAFTHEYAKLNYKWIRENLLKIRKIWLGISLLIVPSIYLLSNIFYKIWFNNTIVIGNNLSLSIAIYTISHTGLMLNCYFLNGVGKIRIQIILYLIVCIVNIPICIFFCKWFGVCGASFSSSLIILFMNVILWVQSNKIINNKAEGIWSK